MHQSVRIAGRTLACAGGTPGKDRQTQTAQVQRRHIGGGKRHITFFAVKEQFATREITDGMAGKVRGGSLGSSLRSASAVASFRKRTRDGAGLCWTMKSASLSV